ncbi:morphogenetic protein [Serratia nevei]|uniref:morphogenetic protein n=1 Tax=Serratia nevei TaxID=2703794 RepID=UPI003FA6B9E7
MKERPVIFNGEMVRAILDGRKTQTRRIAKADNSNHLLGCPFGQVGDLLWVREAYQGPLFNFDQMETYLEDTSKFERPEFCEYRADGGRTPEYYDADDNLRHGWKPSIHMPRWASRITLEITAVRVERLNDISEEDAKAEGVKAGVSPGHEHMMHQVAFSELWQSIYGAENWSANPWVWVIEFKHVEVRDASK